MDLTVNLAPSYRDLKDPTTRQNFDDTPGQIPKLILTLRHRNVKKKLCVQRIGVKHPPTGSAWVPLTMSSSFRCIG